MDEPIRTATSHLLSLHAYCPLESKLEWRGLALLRCQLKPCTSLDLRRILYNHAVQLHDDAHPPRSEPFHALQRVVQPRVICSSLNVAWQLLRTCPLLCAAFVGVKGVDRLAAPHGTWDAGWQGVARDVCTPSLIRGLSDDPRS